MVEKQEYSAFPMKLLGTETFYVPAGENGRPYVFDAIKELDAEGKTVVITDSYLFTPANDSTYANFVRDVLLALKAKKIIWTAYCNREDAAVQAAVVTALQTQGCAFEHKTAEIHDRYWFCPESNKAIAMPSINSIGKRSSSITSVDDVDKQDLRSDLITQGVISDGEQ